MYNKKHIVFDALSSAKKKGVFYNLLFLKRKADVYKIE